MNQKKIYKDPSNKIELDKLHAETKAHAMPTLSSVEATISFVSAAMKRYNMIVVASSRIFACDNANLLASTIGMLSTLLVQVGGRGNILHRES